MFVRHDVSDYGAWKRAYDDFDAERSSMGVTGHGVYQTDGNPNDVTVYHHFDTMEAARAFATSPRLQEVMKHAGVQGTPSLWFTTKA
jgi:heme-degrading monooxygenase HmoA